MANGMDIDTRAFQRELERHVKRLKLNTEQDVEDTAEEVADRIRSHMPSHWNARQYVDTDPGRDGKGFYVDVGVLERAGFYIRFQEYGTVKMAPHPSVRPGLAEGLRRFRPRGWR